MSKFLTYASYLRLDELLSIQTPKSTGPYGPEHDEMLFIVIHQVYELWFKELLHDLDAVVATLEAGQRTSAAGGGTGTPIPHVQLHRLFDFARDPRD